MIEEISLPKKINLKKPINFRNPIEPGSSIGSKPISYNPIITSIYTPNPVRNKVKITNPIDQIDDSVVGTVENDVMSFIDGIVIFLKSFVDKCIPEAELK